jgi:hypothetical protein
VIAHPALGSLAGNVDDYLRDQLAAAEVAEREARVTLARASQQFHAARAWDARQAAAHRRWTARTRHADRTGLAAVTALLVGFTGSILDHPAPGLATAAKLLAVGAASGVWAVTARRAGVLG